MYKRQFLPYPNFTTTARILDDKRLGKQRVECIQILNALRKPNYGWTHHPAVKMWRGYEYGLTVYGKVICDEWKRRGFKDTCWGKLDAIQFEILGQNRDYRSTPFEVAHPMPKWLDDARLSLSHRGNLIRKDPAHYTKFFPEVEPMEGYWWPV